MTPEEIGHFTHSTIVPILKRAQKKIEAAGIKTQMKLPHGDSIKHDNEYYSTYIGQVLYAIPSERMIKVEIVPESDSIVISTEGNPRGFSKPLTELDIDALSEQVDEFVNALIYKESAEQ